MIEVKNSSIEIHNYKLGDCNKLERYLTVFDKMPSGYMIPSFEAFIYDEDEEKLIVPRGYNIPRLQSILNDNDLHYNNTCDKSKNILISCTTEPRDELQKEAIEFLMSRGKYNNLLYESQRFLSLKTGSGKTYVTINAITQYKRRSIIVVDSLNIAEQWRNAFLKFTNLKEKDIYIISGIKSIQKLMDKEKNKLEPTYKIYIAMHQTLNSLFKKDPHNLTKLFNRIKVGIKVYDEAHASWTSMFNIDGMTNTEMTFYLTATPGRSNLDENRLYNYVFEKVPIFGKDNFNTNNYRYSSDEVNENDAWVKAYYINYNSNPSYNDQVAMVKRDRFDMNLYSDYVKLNSYDIFLFIIFKMIDLSLKKNDDRKIAIILIKNDMIQKLYEDISNAYPELTVGRFCGLVPVKEKDLQKEKRIILSTEKSLGKAIDIENLGYLINTVPFSSSIISEQLIGRLRKNAKYSYLFDIADFGFKNCQNNQNTRRKTYDKIVRSSRIANYDPSESEMHDFLNSK